MPRYAVVRHARGWYVCLARGKLPCASATYSAQEAGAHSPYAQYGGGPGTHVATKVRASQLDDAVALRVENTPGVAGQHGPSGWLAEAARS